MASPAADEDVEYVFLSLEDADHVPDLTGGVKIEVRARNDA